MIKLITVLAVVWFLTACTSLDMAIDKTGQEIDKSIGLGEYLTCESLTVASLKRTHCKTKAGCQRWLDFCLPEPGLLDEIVDKVQ